MDSSGQPGGFEQPQTDKGNAIILGHYRISKPITNATKACQSSMAKLKFTNSTPEIFKKKLARSAKRKKPQLLVSTVTESSATPPNMSTPDLNETATLKRDADMEDVIELEGSPEKRHLSNETQLPALAILAQAASLQSPQPTTSINLQSVSPDLPLANIEISRSRPARQSSLKRKLSVSPVAAETFGTLESRTTQVGDSCQSQPAVFRFVELSAETMACPPLRKRVKKSSLESVTPNRGGQPAKLARAPARNHSGITRLKVTKPLQAEMNMDVWRHVLSYCPLGFLLKARTICRSFRKALSNDLAWKDARLNTHGADLPGPLPGLSEMQYADLLAGSGCQSKGCDQIARRTYWAFQRRWCDKCLKAKVMFESDNKHVKTEFPRIFECLTFATFDSWRKYVWVGNKSDFHKPREWQKEQRWPEIGYERTAVHSFMDESDRLRKPGEIERVVVNDEERDAWCTAKIAARKEWMTKLEAVEHYVEKEKQMAIENSARLRSSRAEFFRKRAQALNPPLSAEGLEKIPAYRYAISINLEPTEKSWQTLLLKLQSQRAEAEGIVNDEKRIALMPGGKDLDAIASYRALDEKFHNLDTPEQTLILITADKVIAKLGLPNLKKTAMDNNRWQTSKFDSYLRVPDSLALPKAVIADCDIVQIILRSVFDTYEALPDYWKPIAELSKDCSRYQLCMADAQMVFENRILPIISGWKDEARTKAATLFKCPGCKHSDKNGNRAFDRHFEHIHRKHAPIIGAFGCFRVNEKTIPDWLRFPWYRVEWPRNLPILSHLHSTNGHWDREGRYECATVVTANKDPTLAQNPFQGRQVSACARSPTSSFVETVLNVSRMLRSTAIADQFKTQIVLRYVLSLGLIPDSADRSMDEWTKLSILLEREKLDGLFKARCKVCCGKPNLGKNKFVNRAQPLGLLFTHFKSNHFTYGHTPLESFPDTLELPSEQELGAVWAKIGNETAMNVFENLFPKQQTSGGSNTPHTVGKVEDGE